MSEEKFYKLVDFFLREVYKVLYELFDVKAFRLGAKLEINKASGC